MTITAKVVMLSGTRPHGTARNRLVIWTNR